VLTPTPHLPYLPSAPVSQLHIECTRQETSWREHTRKSIISHVTRCPPPYSHEYIDTLSTHVQSPEERGCLHPLPHDNATDA
jgi:hypothetical protein